MSKGKRNVAVPAIRAPRELEVLINVSPLAEKLAAFADARDWNQFHSPKNLAMALVGEVGELTEIFQWMTEDQSKSAGSDLHTSQAVRDELADVMLYLVRLASVLQVDLNEAVVNKLRENAKKYPADKAKGSNKKYTKL